MVSKKVMVLAVVLGDNDEPVFLKDLKLLSGDENSSVEEYLYHFILHSSLDAVAEKQWQNHLAGSYLGVVDTFREYSVSAWVSSSNAKLLLLHRGIADTSVRLFLKSVHQVWVRSAMNPLLDTADPLSTAFESRIAVLASKFLATSG